MPKTIDTLVEDIYTFIRNPQKITKKDIKDLSEVISERITSSLKRHSEELNDKETLRISAIGKPERKLWFDDQDKKNGESSRNDLDGPTALKFLYGDLVEGLVMWLVTKSGHALTDFQQNVTIDGVSGSNDFRVDGIGVDCKSASGQNFLRFSKGKIKNGDDPFGYMFQLAGYFSEDPEAALLAVNKENGEIALLRVANHEFPDVKSRIVYLKDVLASTEPPQERCYTEVASGPNKALSARCASCKHVLKCWDTDKTLRAFEYSDGVKYLTEVVSTPRVDEVDLGNGAFKASTVAGSEELDETETYQDTSFKRLV